MFTANCHEPLTTMSGTRLELYSLGPGVIGYAIQVGDEIFIPMIEALKQGDGRVGKWLDTLSNRCVIVNCTSERLRGMLERRGWICDMRKVEEQKPKMGHWKRG